MKLILKAKNLMGPKVHKDGFKTSQLCRVAECGSLREIEANVDLLV